MAAMMHPSGDLDYERWREALRSLKGRYNLEGFEPKAFEGWVRPKTIYGFEATDLSMTAHRAERTHRDVRLDGIEHYYAVFQPTGRSTVIQNDHTTELAVGEVALVNSALPVTYVPENNCGRWLSLVLPRQSLVSHLGFEPQGSRFCRRGARAERLLFQLVQNSYE